MRYIIPQNKKKLCPNNKILSVGYFKNRVTDQLDLYYYDFIFILNLLFCIFIHKTNQMKCLQLGARVNVKICLKVKKIKIKFMLVLCVLICIYDAYQAR